MVIKRSATQDARNQSKAKLCGFGLLAKVLTFRTITRYVHYSSLTEYQDKEKIPAVQTPPVANACAEQRYGSSKIKKTGRMKQERERN
jgi:hypothetical protein